MTRIQEIEARIGTGLSMMGDMKQLILELKNAHAHISELSRVGQAMVTAAYLDYDCHCIGDEVDAMQEALVKANELDSLSAPRFVWILKVSHFVSAADVGRVEKLRFTEEASALKAYELASTKLNCAEGYVLSSVRQPYSDGKREEGADYWFSLTRSSARFRIHLKQYPACLSPEDALNLELISQL